MSGQPEDGGYSSFVRVSELLAEAERLAGKAGNPMLFLSLADFEAEGSTPGRSVVELYVLGNMSVESAESIVPVMLERYIREKDNA